MTDRIKGLVVTLKEDMRTDDVESTVNAIRMVATVASVQPIVADFNDHMNRERIRTEMMRKILDVLR